MGKEIRPPVSAGCGQRNPSGAVVAYPLLSGRVRTVTDSSYGLTLTPHSGVACPAPLRSPVPAAGEASALERTHVRMVTDA